MKWVNHKGFILGGLALALIAQVFISLSFRGEGRFHHGQNVFGVFGSPYGKVVAAALQGPIHLMWHDGRKHVHGTGEGEHTHGAGDEEVVEELSPEDKDLKEVEALLAEEKVKRRFSYADWVKQVNLIRYKPTNPYQKTELHQQFIRGVIEEKIRFGWRMDPSHFDTFNMYHLFLTETEIAKSQRDYLKSFSVAKHTLDYCQRFPYDPKANRTSVAAAQAIVDISLNFKREEVAKDAVLAAHQNAYYYLGLFERHLDLAYEHQLLVESEYIELSQSLNVLTKVQEADEAALKRWLAGSERSIEFKENK